MGEAAAGDRVVVIVVGQQMEEEDGMMMMMMMTMITNRQPQSHASVHKDPREMQRTHPAAAAAGKQRRKEGRKGEGREATKAVSGKKIERTRDAWGERGREREKQKGVTRWHR